MGPYLRGFVDELVKLGAFPQQHEAPAPYDAGVADVMDQTQGPNAKTGLKSGAPLQPKPASAKRAPTPLTSPNQMVDYASKSGGGE
jgi:hypothetical protein